MVFSYEQTDKVIQSGDVSKIYELAESCPWAIIKCLVYHRKNDIAADIIKKYGDTKISMYITEKLPWSDITNVIQYLNVGYAMVGLTDSHSRAGLYREYLDSTGDWLGNIIQDIKSYSTFFQVKIGQFIAMVYKRDDVIIGRKGADKLVIRMAPHLSLEDLVDLTRKTIIAGDDESFQVIAMTTRVPISRLVSVVCRNGTSGMYDHLCHYYTADKVIKHITATDLDNLARHGKEPIIRSLPVSKLILPSMVYHAAYNNHESLLRYLLSLSPMLYTKAATSAFKGMSKDCLLYILRSSPVSVTTVVPKEILEDLLRCI